MRQNRRMFLGSLGAGIAFISLPEISPALRLLPIGAPDEDLADTIHRLLLGEGSGGPFVARAETNMFVRAPQPLLPASTALLKMLDSQGFDRCFSSNLNHDEAAQCKEQFERQEDGWRKQGFAAFTKVHRSTVDDRVALGVGGNIDGNRNLVEAAGAAQYGDKAAVPLEKHDPVSLLVGRWLHDRNLSGPEVAQALTPTEKKNATLDSGAVATRYETPVSAVVYIPQPRKDSGIQNAMGVVASMLKTDPNNVYISDLYV